MNPIEHTGPQMPTDRWRALMADDNLKLTEEELKAGWHFCWEFDGLLVGPGMMEQEFCHCLEMPPVLNKQERAAQWMEEIAAALDANTAERKKLLSQCIAAAKAIKRLKNR